MAKNCCKCGGNAGAHDPACPELVPDNLAKYDRGYKHGRAGKPKESDDPAYILGMDAGGGDQVFDHDTSLYGRATY